MKVKCCDGVVFELEDALVYASSTVKKLIVENISSRGCFGGCLFGSAQGDSCEISFAEEISSETLLKINEYVKKHAYAGDNEKSLRSWDLEFIEVDRHTLFALVLLGVVVALELAAIKTGYIQSSKLFHFFALFRFFILSYHLAFSGFQAAHYLKIRDLLDLSCEAVMTENDTTPEEEEEYQGTTIGEEKGKNIISEELLGQQCSMEERGGIHAVNLIKGGSSKWDNARTSLKLYIENMSVKRLSDEEVANLAEDYRACKIQQCLATVLKPMKYKMKHSRWGVQTVTSICEGCKRESHS
ncbi:transmembrane protein, putative [Medicago truncatula]|uniref:Transmembrane protein, putative n=1 Tax=Medicago truncatula TaxID=3880 RepID=A0A072VSI9_MEDTR|nr:transmembrane protein, putative [Medicago truncatula]